MVPHCSKLQKLKLGISIFVALFTFVIFDDTVQVPVDDTVHGPRYGPGTGSGTVLLMLAAWLRLSCSLELRKDLPNAFRAC